MQVLARKLAGKRLLRPRTGTQDPPPMVGIIQRSNLLEKIVRLNYDVVTRRIGLTTREKLSILSKGFLKRIS